MSNEEKAINLLRSADIDKETGDVQWHTWYKGIDKDVKKAFDVAIEALEQEPVLDKVREEIKGMYRVILKGTPEDDWAVKWNDCLDEVLQIIDKYKESEG